MATRFGRIQRQLGTTGVHVTHDQAEAMTLSDRIMVMNEGKIEQVDTPVRIYHRPETRFVAHFIGGANLVEATVRAADKGRLVLHALGTTLLVTDNAEHAVCHTCYRLPPH